MKADIKVPAVGESISEATIGEWTKKSGEFVKRDEIILVLETDKASVEVVAPNDGVLNTLAKAGDTVKIGAVVASIDTEGVATAGMPAPQNNAQAQASASAPALVANNAPGAPPADPASGGAGISGVTVLSPAVRRVVEEKGLNPSEIKGTGKDGRLTKADVESANKTSAPAINGNGSGGLGAKQAGPATPVPVLAKSAPGEVKRVPMSSIRKKIAERLVAAQHTAAILTTFNEIDMTAAQSLRERYKDKFKEKYGVSLGFMGIFVKAAIEALKEMPAVNASLDGTDILYKNFYNIGVAVSTEKGLVVPVVRNADQLSIAQVEQAIRAFALKGRDGKISIDDLSEGTFTISNGGVFGSLMSTPILNPPQSAILGMHKVQDRPVAINGKVEIRPMMYVALSYDHRMIDGKEAVTFLVKIKECVENPERILLNI